jgi:hypothetical protein
MQQPSDEFYVGYVDRAPAGLARFVKRVVALLAVGVVGLFGLMASTQGPQPTGVFEFLEPREFEGVLYAEPLPYLRMTSPGGGVSRLLLVGFGKFGAPEAYLQHDERKVAFRGNLIYRAGLAMVEMNDPESFRELGPPGPDEGRSRSGPIGEVRLTGELVDTKCWLGVMRPATGKVHRGCAVRCLAGGIPPGLLVRDPAGNADVFLLVGDDGGRLDFDPQWAARTVSVRGRLETADGLPVVRVSELGLM